MTKTESALEERIGLVETRVTKINESLESLRHDLRAQLMTYHNLGKEAWEKKKFNLYKEIRKKFSTGDDLLYIHFHEHMGLPWEHS